MGCRALIIEDDHAIADMLQTKLAREGHKVAIAGHQHVAYNLLDEELFDFVLLDLKLPTDENDMAPDMEVGFAILNRIRDRFAQDTLPVIVMTAHEETSQTAVRALKALANDYITKPFEDSTVSLDEKLAGIARCIEEARKSPAGKGTPSAKHKIVFKKDCVEISGIEVGGRSADLLRLLGSKTLMLSSDGTGEGDTRMPGRKIAEAMKVEEATVRQYVTRFRKRIATEHEQRGLGPIQEQDIIRNARDWKGYDLNFETCFISRE